MYLLKWLIILVVCNTIEGACFWYSWLFLLSMIWMTALVVDDMVDCFYCGWYGWLQLSVIWMSCFGVCLSGYAAEQVTFDRRDIPGILLNVTLNTKTNTCNIWPDLPPRESRYPSSAVCFADVSMVTRAPPSILQ